jgi:NADPH-dependent ferric siderophore reductase
VRRVNDATPSPIVGTVERVEPVVPGLVRVVLGGPGLASFEDSIWTDAYVNLLFVPEGAPYSVPFDVTEARSLSRELWPVPRRFTVRRWDAGRRELWIDFVTHGDEGTAGRWAQRARPGDLLQLQGPSGAYRPDPDISCHLMVGDESALPAIAASLEAVPSDARALVVGLVEGPEAELELATQGALEVAWLHRSTLTGPSDGALTAAVAALEFPADDVQAFVHGEAVETRAVRRHLLGERKMPRERLSVSPYWRRTFTDERWREVKKAWLREVEADV